MPKFRSIASVFSIRPTIFHRKRFLSITPDQIILTRTVSAPPIIFSKADVESFRYSITGLRGYLFMIGRIYRIEVRDHLGRIMKFRFWSLYGVRSRKLSEKYSAILQSLYSEFFNEMAMHYVSLLENQLGFSLAGVGLSPEGIADMKLRHIPWNRIALKTYHRYFALYDVINPSNYRTLEYGMDWNAAILYAVVQHMVRKQSHSLAPRQ